MVRKKILEKALELACREMVLSVPVKGNALRRYISTKPDLWIAEAQAETEDEKKDTGC